MNHKQTHNIQQLKLHFKQWSNNGYATFCSMGKVVHIGNLAISLTQWIGNIVELIEETLKVCIDKETDDVTDAIIESELLQLVPVIASTPVVCEKKLFKKTNNINCR